MGLCHVDNSQRTLERKERVVEIGKTNHDRGDGVAGKSGEKMVNDRINSNQPRIPIWHLSPGLVIVDGVDVV